MQMSIVTWATVAVLGAVLVSACDETQTLGAGVSCADDPEDGAPCATNGKECSYSFVVQSTITRTCSGVCLDGTWSMECHENVVGYCDEVGYAQCPVDLPSKGASCMIECLLHDVCRYDAQTACGVTDVLAICDYSTYRWQLAFGCAEGWDGVGGTGGGGTGGAGGA